MPHNLFAYTPPGSEPPYLSINRMPDGTVEFTVRSTKQLGGHTAMINLPSVEFTRLLGST